MEKMIQELLEEDKDRVALFHYIYKGLDPCLYPEERFIRAIQSSRDHGPLITDIRGAGFTCQEVIEMAKENERNEADSLDVTI